MQVRLLASTLVNAHTLSDAYGYDMFDSFSDRETDADALSEAAGRLCYMSFDRPNPATRRNVDYLANILRQGHESVLEHASVTFLVRGVSRALLTELTRHRHLSFSVVSQRYVDYSETEPVIPPAVKEAGANFWVRSAYALAVESYEGLVKRLKEAGYNRKQAREAARAVLPNAAPVDLIVTGNLRAWRDVLKKRHNTAADAEMQELARLVLAELRVTAPSSFQDIPTEPYGSWGAHE